MKALALLPFLAASRSPAVVVSRAIGLGSTNELVQLQVAWANAAWSRQGAADAAGSANGGRPPRLADRLNANDIASIFAAVNERVHLTEDEELELRLEQGLATLTFLRHDGVVVVILPAPALPPQRPQTDTALATAPAGRTETRKVPSFIDAFEKSEMGRRIAVFPWEKTSLGPISTWPLTLQVSAASMLASPFRTYITWGPDGVFIYNDAYIGAAQTKHPHCLGLPIAEAWPEVIEALNIPIQTALRGDVYYTKDADLPLLRNGILEESFHTFSFTPIRDATGAVFGTTCVSFETTPEVLTERRMATVQELVQRTSGARSVVDFCNSALDCLGQNPSDFPFVLLYTSEAVDVKPSKRKDWAVPVEQNVGRAAIKLSLRGSVGVPESHPFHITDCYVDLSGSNSGSDSTGRTPHVEFSWPFDQAVRQMEPVFLDDIAALASSLPGRAWGENPRQAVIKPIWTEGKEFPAAILVFGVNPRSHYTNSYKGFARVITRHVGIGLLSVQNAEADLNRANELLALDRAKTSFFTTTSHELRTPLTLITGPLEDILDGKDLGRGVREKLEMVTRNANRLLSMVNKLLDFSALEGGRTKTIFHPINLGSFTAELASLFRDAVERGGLEFDVDCDDDPPNALPTYISRDLYRNVIFNLLGNALKYCPSGTISVRLRSTLAECVLEVADTGVGIPPEELSKIFERFHRVQNIYHSAPGTGIGLALTLEVVKTLGGQLEVTSEVGQGSTFFVKFRRGYIHLPSEQVSHHRISEDDELERATAKLSESEIKEATSYRYDTVADRHPFPSDGTGESTSGGSSSGKDDYFGGTLDMLNIRDSTILLAEDSPDLRSYISALLSKNYHVVAVPDGQSALEYALQHPPSLVLTDVMMPRLGGEGLLEALRSNPRTALIPVIFLSAAAGSDSRAQALERGVDDYLVKPFQSRELLARVRVHLTLGRMRQELETRVAERTAELNESELQYRALAQRYSAINDLAPVGIFQMSSTAEVLYTNARWHEISGHPPERPLSDWAEAVHPDDVHILQQLVTEIQDDGRLSANVQFRYKHGRWAQLEFRKVLAFGPSVDYIGTITDITPMKTIEALHLETVEQRAADADTHRRQIEAFIDITSHELRNPLSGVWQNAEVVKASLEDTAELILQMQEGQMPDEDEINDLAQEMKENLDGLSAILLCAAHQGRIADDILNVSRLNMGLLTIQRTTFDLAVKLKEVVTMFEAECHAKGITLQLVIDPSIHALDATCIIADPSRVAQVVVNLLLNSAKFTPFRGRITLVATASSNPPPLRDDVLRVGQTDLEDTSNWVSPLWITISVEDTGKGLTKEEMAILFERFAQINPRTDQYGGAGLGLYLSKSLVELHHGWIEVESQPGHGSQFRFAIPVERGTGNVDSLGGRRPSLANRRSSFNTGEPKRKLRRAVVPLNDAVPPAEPIEPLHVLVVEDNEINQKVLKRQLTNRHYTVTVANNGQEALDILHAKSVENKPFSVILMDLQMPVMGGLEAIRKLRAREASEGGKPYGVIAVTGNARQDQIDTYLAEGFTDVAIKPYSFTDLVGQIEKITGRPATPVEDDRGGKRSRV